MVMTRLAAVRSRVMGDDDDRPVFPAGRLKQEQGKVLAGLRVQIGLVGEDRAGVDGQGPGDFHDR